jgi:hypothetical protein
LRIPNRSVRPEDFAGGRGRCQNLPCRAPLEPPYLTARLCLPGGTLETVLCAQCMPGPAGETYPALRLEVVAAGPAADLVFVRPASEVPAPPDPPGGPTPPPARPRRGSRRLTFRALAKLEPRLNDLLAAARAFHKSRAKVFCANAVWYGYPGFRPGLKALLCRLVGWSRKEGGVLQTSEAYDVAYQAIYRALPDCRGRCACSGLREFWL